MNDPVVERRLIHAILDAGSLSTVQTVGVTPDWLDDIGAKNALQVIIDYHGAAATMGQVPGRSYLVRCMAMVPGDSGGETVEQICETLRHARLGSLIARAITPAVSLNTTDPSAALMQLMAALNSADIQRLQAKGRATTLQDLIPDLFQHYIDSAIDAGVTGVLTPFPALTRSTKGWQRGDICTVYGPSGNYKSWILLQFLLTALLTDPRNVLFVTSEMPPAQCGVRLLTLLNGWNFNDYRDRKYPTNVVVKMLSQAGAERVSFYQPSGTDAQALGEIRSEIQRLNGCGGVSVVFVDGHYRLAGKPDWEYVSALTKGTKVLAMDPDLGRPPFILAAQEGSEKGKPTNAVYRHESSLMMYVTKTALGRVFMQTTKVREGPSVELDIDVNLRMGCIQQISAKSEADGMSGGSGGLT